MSNMISVQVPATITFAIKYHGNQTVKLEGKSGEWFAWAISNGIRQSVGDADAGKAGTTAGKKAVWAKFDRIAQGEVPSGGFGARLSDKDKALKAAMVASKVAGKLFTFGKGESLIEGLERMASELRAHAGKEFDPAVHIEQLEDKLEASPVYKAKMEELAAARKVKDAQADNELSLDD